MVIMEGVGLQSIDDVCVKQASNDFDFVAMPMLTFASPLFALFCVDKPAVQALCRGCLRDI